MMVGRDLRPSLLLRHPGGHAGPNSGAALRVQRPADAVADSDSGFDGPVRGQRPTRAPADLRRQPPLSQQFTVSLVQESLELPGVVEGLELNIAPLTALCVVAVVKRNEPPDAVIVRVHR